MVKDRIIQKNDLKTLVHKVRYAGKYMRCATNREQKQYTKYNKTSPFSENASKRQNSVMKCLGVERRKEKSQGAKNVRQRVPDAVRASILHVFAFII